MFLSFFYLYYVLLIIADKVTEFKGQKPIILCDSYAKIIAKGTSEKDLPTTYKELAQLIKDTKDPEIQARKILEQLLRLN